MNEQYVIISGDPIDGFSIIGPFPTHDFAVGYAEDHYPERIWWVTPLVKAA